MNIESLKSLKNIYNIINILIKSNLIKEQYLLSKIDNIDDINNRYEITFINQKNKIIIFIYLNEEDKFKGYIIKNNSSGETIRQKIKFERLSPNNNICRFSINCDNYNKKYIIYYYGNKEIGYQKINNSIINFTSKKVKLKSLKNQ